MKPGARLSAAVEILSEILERHRPTSLALADWARASRFAGSGDRSAIGTLVYDALRRRLSLAAAMGEETPRALAIGAAARAFGVSRDAVAGMADGSRFALAPLSDHELAGLDRVGEVLPDVPDHVRADLPDWLAPSLGRVFGERLVEEGQALARRAPIDLRANALKATRERVIDAFAQYGAQPTPWTPTGVRIPAPVGGARAPNVEADPAHGRGWFEVQDEGSQLAAALAGAGPRMQVLDLCAGAGGKTLALGAAMRNTGQIYAYDASKHQLRPIFERLKRAGVRNAQVLQPGDEAALSELGPRFDLVFVDAPCTGSGVWRRRPDAKWRLKPANLEQRLAEQRAVLGLAQSLVRPGGRLAYVTCSLLPEENGDQARWFRETYPVFVPLAFGQAWEKELGSAPPASADGDAVNLLVTPASHDTDGFFVALFERSADGG